MQDTHHIMYYSKYRIVLCCCLGKVVACYHLFALAKVV